MELTTGQMIDQLKVGEVAEKYSVSGTETAHYVTKIESGIIGFSNKDGENVRDIHSLNSFFLKSKWKILPRYVTFEEAMKALKDGYGVTLHLEDGGYVNFCEADKLKFVADEVTGITFSDLAKDRWTIED